MGAAGLFLAIALLGACVAVPTTTPPPPTLTVDGLVTLVEGTSPTDVMGFTLRTMDGRLIAFTIGRLDLTGDAFPAGHLREHIATAQPVRVTYVAAGSSPLAIRLEDAPP